MISTPPGVKKRSSLWRFGGGGAVGVAVFSLFSSSLRLGTAPEQAAGGATGVLGVVFFLPSSSFPHADVSPRLGMAPELATGGATGASGVVVFATFLPPLFPLFGIFVVVASVFKSSSSSSLSSWSSSLGI